MTDDLSAELRSKLVQTGGSIIVKQLDRAVKLTARRVRSPSPEGSKSKRASPWRTPGPRETQWGRIGPPPVASPASPKADEKAPRKGGRFAFGSADNRNKDYPGRGRTRSPVREGKHVGKGREPKGAGKDRPQPQTDSGQVSPTRVQPGSSTTQKGSPSSATFQRIPSTEVLESPISVAGFSDIEWLGGANSSQASSSPTRARRSPTATHLVSHSDESLKGSPMTQSFSSPSLSRSMKMEGNAPLRHRAKYAETALPKPKKVTDKQGTPSEICDLRRLLKTTFRSRRRAFQEIDTNGDGMVSYAELISVLDRLKVPWGDICTAYNLSVAFKLMDADEKGSLTIDEFLGESDDEAFCGPQKLYVTFGAASNLPQAKRGEDDLMWCTCEVKSKKDSCKHPACTTKAVPSSSNPTWNETHVLDPWHTDEALEFIVTGSIPGGCNWKKDQARSRVEGRVVLESRHFFPDAFEGELPMMFVSDRSAKLFVKVVPVLKTNEKKDDGKNAARRVHTRQFLAEVREFQNPTLALQFADWASQDNRWSLFQGLFATVPHSSGVPTHTHVNSDAFTKFCRQHGYQGDLDTIFWEIQRECRTRDYEAWRRKAGLPRDLITLRQFKFFAWRCTGLIAQLAPRAWGSPTCALVNTLRHRRGTALRGWRLDVDVRENGRVAHVDFMHALRKANMGCQVKQLWQGLRPDGSTLPLEFGELDPAEAAIVESFCRMLYRVVGHDTAKAFEIMDKRKQTFLSFDDFCKGSVALGWNGNKNHMRFVFRSLDRDGLGRLGLEDFQYLLKVSNLYNKHHSTEGSSFVTELIRWSQQELGGANVLFEKLGLEKRDSEISVSVMAERLTSLGFPGDSRQAAMKAARQDSSMMVTADTLYHLISGFTRGSCFSSAPKAQNAGNTHRFVARQAWKEITMNTEKWNKEMPPQSRSYFSVPERDHTSHVSVAGCIKDINTRALPRCHTCPVQLKRVLSARNCSSPSHGEFDQPSPEWSRSSSTHLNSPPSMTRATSPSLMGGSGSGGTDTSPSVQSPSRTALAPAPRVASTLVKEVRRPVDDGEPLTDEIVFKYMREQHWRLPELFRAIDRDVLGDCEITAKELGRWLRKNLGVTRAECDALVRQIDLEDGHSASYIEWLRGLEHRYLDWWGKQPAHAGENDTTDAYIENSKDGILTGEDDDVY
eukprot:TRINITY_DN28028_c0_g1_i1.p1 TRINITY_DN28028_c0_g1~~TRINITY_DN28028_c0_g1_i1.p1  ORF type:complete len:1322 (-),score=178.78 TRINITY_DN28028_c0_g1_i1:363-3893(-)